MTRSTVGRAARRRLGRTGAALAAVLAVLIADPATVDPVVAVAAQEAPPTTTAAPDPTSTTAPAPPVPDESSPTTTDPPPATVGEQAAASSDGRPNFVVFYTDDQTLEQMRVLSRTAGLIGGTGITFSESSVSYALCCPSRATLLTGQYTQNNGVWSIFDDTPYRPLPRAAAAADDAAPEGWADFRDDAEADSLAVALSRAGYHTGLVGKYLNGYGDRERYGYDPTYVPPGWSDWQAGIHPWINDYWNTRINSNGTVVDLAGRYQTDAFAEIGEDVLDRASASGRPFFVLLSFFAPHRAHDGATRATWPWPVPAPRHEGAFAGTTAPRGGSFNEADLSDKPQWLRDRYARRLRADDIASIDTRYRRELESLLAVDEAVDRLVDRLAQLGELDDTMLVFTSDNGYFHGEHRIPAKKYLPYEEAIHVPLLISGPMVAAGRRGTVVDQPVNNVDLAPTILDYAGARPLRRPDGRSLRPVLEGTDQAWSVDGGRFRRSPSRHRPVYIMGVRGGCAGHCPRTFSGVRSGNGWVYWKWETAGQPAELYDLGRDPHQLRNLAGDRRYRAVRDRLERQRRLLVDCAGPSCEVPPYGYLDLPRSGRAPWRAAATWADAAGLGAAYGDGTFRPGRAITREEYVDWLWREAGAPRGFPRHRLRRVPSRVEPAVRWAVARGVIANRAVVFPAREAIKRKLAVRWLWRAAGRPRGHGPHRFVDVPVRNPEVRWARATGILRTANRRFRPEAALIRSGAVRWVHRYAT